MTVPHDEQPLTRRQLRDLERQKPRKQQKEEAKAAEEAEATRRADEAARAAAERAAFEAQATAAVVSGAADAAPVTTPDAVVPDSAPSEPAEPTSVELEAAPAQAEPTPSASTETPAPTGAPVVAWSAVDAAPAEQAAAEPSVPVAESAAPAPILSRRARRALSADHPLAESNGDGSAAGAAAGVAGVAAGAAASSTGPIIAEIMPDEPAVEAEVITDDEPEFVSSHSASAGDSEAEPASAPMVEELMVVDDVTPGEIAADEEVLAEIDDTPAPEPVHIVTIDETPSAPILAPLFQARGSVPAADTTTASITPDDLTKSSFDDLIASRGIGSSNSVTSTSALVLPSVPNHGDVGTALDETGEVIITGSIDLPMSLGSTGAAPADGLESSELDAFLDPESEVGSDVAPVSATRAISTHGPSSGLVTPPKRRGANAPVILMITAGVLAVGVVGLLLAAFIFRIF